MFRIFLLISFPVVTMSQVVNVESKRQSDASGISGSIGTSFEYNSSKQVDWEFSNTSYLQWDNINFSVLFLNEINFDRAGGVDFSNDGYQHLRISRHLNNRYSLESFAQNQFDPVRNIKNRKLLGLGLRYRIFNQNFIGVSNFYENELLSSDERFSTVRLNLYIRLNLKINELVSLIFTNYIQPDIINLEDLKLSNETDIRFKISKRLSFSNSWSISYDSYPSNGVPNYIYNIQNGLIFEF